MLEPAKGKWILRAAAPKYKSSSHICNRKGGVVRIYTRLASRVVEDLVSELRLASAQTDRPATTARLFSTRPGLHSESDDMSL